MAATVRIARATASTASVVSVTRSRSTAYAIAGAVRVAGVTAQAPKNLATVRIAEVSAQALKSVNVRIAAITAVPVKSTAVWNGTQWVLTDPHGLNRNNSVSLVSGGSYVSTVITSRSTSRSTAGSFVSRSGTLTLSGTGTLSLSGVKNANPGNGSGTLSLTGGGTLTLTGSGTQANQPGIYVFADVTNSPPRIVIDVVQAGGATGVIYRVDAAGNRNAVRSANPATLNAGGWVGYDYEAPFAQSLTYQVVASSTFTSDPVILDPQTPWLIHPGIPDLSQPLRVVGYGDRTRESSAGVHVVSGRRNPIVITDGQRHAPTFDLQVGTSTEDDYQALSSLLDDTTAMLLQISYPGSKTRCQWVSIGTVTEAEPAAPYFASEVTIWTLSCIETSAPVGMQQAQRTWRTVMGQFATWRDAMAVYATWRDFITDNPS